MSRVWMFVYVDCMFVNTPTIQVIQDTGIEERDRVYLKTKKKSNCSDLKIRMQQ